jgi:hypothetical protein
MVKRLNATNIRFRSNGLPGLANDTEMLGQWHLRTSIASQ